LKNRVLWQYHTSSGGEIVLFGVTFSLLRVQTVTGAVNKTKCTTSVDILFQGDAANPGNVLSLRGVFSLN
jgi:hypothetical protein